MAVSEFAKMIDGSAEITASMSVKEGDYNTAAAGYDSATYYKPTWKDDFDGSDIDYSKWDVKWEMKSGYSNAKNGKVQYRGSKALNNNYVSNGCLYQNAVETSDAYYGGWFTTQKMMEYQYGYIELSCINPKGMGFWTTLWSCSEGRGDYLYKSETDINECYGPGTWVFGNTFAWPKDADAKAVLGIPADQQGTVHVNNKRSSLDDRGFWMDFHTYGFEWLDNTHVRFTCDGEAYVDQQLREGPEQSVYEQPAYLILSLATGSGNHGEPTTDPNEWNNSNKFITDWVHIYQKDGQHMFNYNKSTDSWTQTR
jgi:beta-glucanase (GH16 family)